jgi:hypothetical protein
MNSGRSVAGFCLLALRNRYTRVYGRQEKTRGEQVQDKPDFTLRHVIVKKYLCTLDHGYTSIVISYFHAPHTCGFIRVRVE